MSRILPDHVRVRGEGDRSLLTGSAAVFALRLAGMGLAFGLNVLMGRLLGPDAVGLYYLGLTAATVGGVLGAMGLGNAVIRYIGVRAAASDWAGVAGVYRRALGVALVAGVVVGVALVAGAGWLAEEVFGKPSLTGVLRWMGLGVAPLSLVLVHVEGLKGIYRPALASGLQFLVMPLVTLVVFLAVGWRMGATGAAMAWLAGVLSALIFGVVVWRRVAPRAGRVDMSSASGLMRTSLPLLVIGLVGIVMDWTDLLLLGMWENAGVVGVYGAALRVAMLVSFVLVAVNAVAAPRFAHLHASGQLGELERLTRRVAGLTAVASLPLVGMLLVASEQVMGIFGVEFMVGGQWLGILVLGQAVNVATGSVGFVLIMSGREKLLQYNVILAAGLKVVLGVWLIPRYGATGAAVANAVALAAMNLASVFLVYRSLSIVAVPIPGWRLRDDA